MWECCKAEIHFMKAAWKELLILKGAPLISAAPLILKVSQFTSRRDNNTACENSCMSSVALIELGQEK